MLLHGGYRAEIGARHRSVKVALSVQLLVRFSSNRGEREKAAEQRAEIDEQGNKQLEHSGIGCDAK
jgi:hypothetical protein